MDRRNFLRQCGLITLGGIVAGSAALELFEKLTWRRRLYPGSSFTATELSDAELSAILRDVYAEFSDYVFPLCTPFIPGPFSFAERQPRAYAVYSPGSARPRRLVA